MIAHNHCKLYTYAAAAAYQHGDDDAHDGISDPHCLVASLTARHSDDPDVSLTENIILVLHELLLNCAAACAPFMEQVAASPFRKP